MKSTILRSLLLIAVISAFVAEAAQQKESPFKALNEARSAFNKAEGEVFRGTKAADYRTLADTERFDKAQGSLNWVFALPLKNDSRVRFIVADFRDGKFANGEMRKMGLKPEKIDAAAFDALRRDFAMLAIKSGTSGKDRVCAFYPAGNVSDTEQMHILHFGVQMSANPSVRYTAGLCGIDRPLGVNVGGLKYAYSIKTPDGDVLDMGDASRAEKMKEIMRSQLETLHPKRKGMFSDRDLVDMYCDGLFEYRPIK